MITSTLSKEMLLGTGTGPISSLWGPQVIKTTMECITEVQSLNIAPWTCIKPHGHDNQWEIWLRFSDNTAFVCLKDEEHQLCNNSSIMMNIMAIKGTADYTYDELKTFLQNLGFVVIHGSLIVNEPSR